tara:strand:+ start:1324 stop:2166 length:843 start_codon:yes stop_codon:yes gene_type:complete
MSKRFTVGCVQNSAIDDVDLNILEASELIRRAVDEGADFVCMPEYFTCLEQSDSLYIDRGYYESDHPALQKFSDLAVELKTWLLLGSIAVKLGDTKVGNRSYLLSATGEVVQTYDKIHLFDVVLKRGEFYRESKTVRPGSHACVAETPWGRLGFSVCYDVRFPQLYRALAHAGADFISIPAAFTATTGAAHWHVLVRARAIETGCYVFAPGQCGRRPWGRRTYGHSLIVDPWGEVLADAGESPGIIVVEIDPDKVSEARKMIPSLNHDKMIVGPSRERYS